MLSFTDMKVSAENLTSYKVSWSHVRRIWQFVLNIYHVSHNRCGCQLSKLAAACILYWRPPPTFYIGGRLYSTLAAAIVESGGRLIIVGGRVSGIVRGRLGG